jgi:hypothetical protein
VATGDEGEEAGKEISVGVREGTRRYPPDKTDEQRKKLNQKF